MTNLTTNELNVLTAIALHEMAPSNYSVPETIEDTGTYCWADDFAAHANLTVPQVKGVLSSLVKKEMIVIEDYDKEENLVNFTEAGFAAYRATLDIAPDSECKPSLTAQQVDELLSETLDSAAVSASFDEHGPRVQEQLRALQVQFVALEIAARQARTAMYAFKKVAETSYFDTTINALSLALDSGPKEVGRGAE